jgi:hypothetical protein
LKCPKSSLYCLVQFLHSHIGKICRGLLVQIQVCVHCSTIMYDLSTYPYIIPEIQPMLYSLVAFPHTPHDHTSTFAMIGVRAFALITRGGCWYEIHPRVAPGDLFSITKYKPYLVRNTTHLPATQIQRTNSAKKDTRAEFTTINRHNK